MSEGRDVCLINIPGSLLGDFFQLPEGARVITCRYALETDQLHVQVAGLGAATGLFPETKEGLRCPEVVLYCRDVQQEDGSKVAVVDWVKALVYLPSEPTHTPAEII